jgi:enoyl-CoA hydratase/carnithine racemase
MEIRNEVPEMETGYRDLLYDVAGPVATITLNRPEKLNAVSRNLYSEIRHALIRADFDDRVEVIVLTGNGRAFSAGGDLGEVNDLHGEDARIDLAAWPATSHATFQQVLDTSKPVVARVNGLAHAAGFNLALNSDVAIAVDTATFRMPQGLRGIASPTGPQLVQAVGLARAKLLLLTAKEITAAEALEWGLLAEVTTADQLDSAVQTMVEQLLAVQPLARTLTKQAMNRGLPPADVSILSVSMASPESEAGTRRFGSAAKSDGQQA